MSKKLHGYTLMYLKKTMAEAKMLEIPCRSTPIVGE